ITEVSKLGGATVYDFVRRAMITEVSKLGGATVYDFVRRAMVLILTNEFANEYSWLCRKGKKPFHTTNIAKMIISMICCSCRFNKKSKGNGGFYSNMATESVRSTQQ
uniref:Uncharacterized protein LOC114346604 n=1 Tax=Diabrotica virgifera virgifera TaxID=50390 RepID=A0A6P7H3N7_DIAVI